MRNNRRFGILSLVMIAMFAVVPAVSAHPLGNFTINHFARLHVSPDKIWVDYVLDMAEIPAFQEITLLDINQDGKASPEELSGYPERQCQALLGQVILQENETPIPAALSRSEISFPAGAGGLSTLRLSCGFQSAAVRLSTGDRAAFLDNSYPDRLGWREIVVSAEGVALEGQYATTSVSHELTAYPQDLLASPLDVRQVSLEVGSGGSGALAGSTAQNGSSKPRAWTAGARSDRFTQLITLQDTTPAGILLALGIAFIWGGLHSLTPGHGKTIVAAYLVSSRGTALHALYLGLVTTVTHTAGVFLLGFLTYFASRYILPEQLFPWISLLSGLLVIAIGIGLFSSRLRGTRAWGIIRSWMKKPAEYGIAGPGKARTAVPIRVATLAARAPAHDSASSPVWVIHHHADGTVHRHGAGDPGHAHGSGEHTHLPPGAEGGQVTWRSLLGLGISGGLLPCPSALVVLLGAIALDRVGFGILLVVAFSLGLAGVLTGIGLMLVFARRFFDHLPVHSRLAELIPAGSALFITVLGVGITWQALIQLGWIRI